MSTEFLNNKEWLIEQHHIGGCSINHIAKTLNTSIYNVDRAFKHYNIKVVPGGIGLHAYNQLNNVEWLIDQHHTNSRSLANIARELNVGHVTVNNYFKKHKISIRTHNIDIDIVAKLENIEWLIDQHHIKDIPIYVIAEQLKVSSDYVYNKCRALKLDVATHRLQYSTHKLLNSKEWLTEQHHHLKKEIIDIATTLNISYTTVANYCKLLNVKIYNYNIHDEFQNKAILLNIFNQAGRCINTVANMFNTHPATIKKYLLQHNIIQLRVSKSTIDLLNNKDWLIAQHHTNNISLIDLSSKLQITTTTLKKYLRKHNIYAIPKYYQSIDVYTLLNDANWLKDQHHNQQRTACEIADELGVHSCTVGVQFKWFGIEVVSFARSRAEKEIVEFLKSNINNEILLNVRNIIPPKELDIYLPELKLSIEYCGLFYHNDAHLFKSYHYDKLKQCNSLGIRLITIFEDEWLLKQNIVKDKLLHILHNTNQHNIPARKCKVVSLTTIEKNNFLNAYHIQGSGSGSINYGLLYNEELIAAITFIKKQNGIYELNRYATSCNVPGGFSKLLSHFEKNNTYSQIITYADLRWSEGKLYEKIGFTKIHTTGPIYEYIIKGVRVHRSLYARKHLPKKLGDKFDPNLTEFENMDNAKIGRIWNCGLIKYIKFFV